MSVLPGYDVNLNLQAYNRQTACGCVKISEDLERYARVISMTRPELVVEMGTGTGASASWFADRVDRVVTVDNNLANRKHELVHDQVTYIIGDSTDPDVVAEVTMLARGRRTMVVLDSDHAADHVAREIELYSSLVTPGCYLVVEDGVNRWLSSPETGSPLDAIERTLIKNPGDFTRDIATESLYPVTMYPAGWWRKDD